MRKKPSTSSFCNEEIEENLNDRKEVQATGAIKVKTYKAFFNASQSHLFVVIVFIAFVAAQFAWSGGDYFLSAW